MSIETNLIVKLNDKCHPVQRGDIYEGPLHEALVTANLGVVVGGGSMLDEDGNIDYCEIEVKIIGNLEQGVKLITEKLEENGVPKGSKIILRAGEIEIGSCEVMAIHFDNCSLPQAVYKAFNINDVLQELEAQLGHSGKRYSHTVTNKELVVFYGGKSFKVMEQKILEFVRKHPLCENSKITRTA